MIQRLPVPLKYGGNIYCEATLKKYTVGTITDTQKTLRTADTFRGIGTFLSGCIDSIDGVTDKAQIRQIVMAMPYVSASTLMLKALTMSGYDAIEGIYPCPLCGKEKICTYNSDPDMDTADHLNSLGVFYTDDENACIEHDLLYPVTIDIPFDNSDEVSISTINSLKIAYPTLQMCSVAAMRVGEKDESALQGEIYVESLISVNGIDVPRKWKTRYLNMILSRMDIDDMAILAEKSKAYGIRTVTTKRCHCGKEWEEALNTANFFASALRSVKR